MRPVWCFLLPLVPVLLVGAGPAAAIGLDLSQQSGGKPIDITSDNGMEWRQDAQTMTAHGNAKAVQGDVTVTSDDLTAFYRDKKGGGGSEIWRIEAIGKVMITSADSRAVSDRAVYDVDSAVLVLTGKGLKLTSRNTTVTARDSLEYWDRKNMAVARGNALAIQEDKRIRADVLTAHFVKGPDAKGKNGGDGQAQTDHIDRIDAFHHVRMDTSTDTAFGDRGVYNVETGIATLAGSVRITHGKNQLEGKFAVVDTNSGIGRLLPGPPDARTGGRVHGYLVPASQEPGAAPGGKGRSPSKGSSN